MINITGIYGLHNIINGKWYVGQAQDIQKRNSEELFRLAHGHFHTDGKKHHIDYAWAKYGAGAFEWVVLEECELNELNEKERFWINEKKSYTDGYNNTLGGEGVRGYRISAESREKLCRRMKEAWQDTEWRAQQSASHVGKHLSEQSRQKLRIANSGRPCPDSAKQKLSALRKGKIPTCAKMPYTEEHKNKIRQAQTGRRATEETREKLSRAHGKRIVCVEIGAIFQHAAEAAKRTGMSQGGIYHCLKGRSSTSGGLHWRYFEEGDSR